MTSPSTRPRLAIVNTNEDLIDLLKAFFEGEGYEVVTAHVRVLRTQTEDLERFIAMHDPQILLWDIAMPYDENWRYFQIIKQSPVMRGRRFVLTTTNEKRVREVAGVDEEIVEVVGKPFDLQRLTEAVARARQAQE
jgi:CheY-like chemotaxis protein